MKWSWRLFAVLEAGTSRLVLLLAGRNTNLRKTPSGVGRWRVIALTNNFSKTNADSIGEAPPSAEDYRDLTVQSELAFLGWEDGPTPPRLRALFDDFCDSSTLGMRFDLLSPFRVTTIIHP